MARSKHSSPRLALTITEADWLEAKESASGGCLIVEAVQRQYPHLSRITVDMATIRVTDQQKGERYIYLTPATAQYFLLALDQGWRYPNQSLTLKAAVQILPVITTTARKTRNETRRVELEALEAAGTVTAKQKTALTKLRRTERPTARGRADVKDAGDSHAAVVRGGPPRVQGPAHPNLLRGRDRYFGAKTAEPSRVFTEAVEEALRARMEQQQETST